MADKKKAVAEEKPAVAEPKPTPVLEQPVPVDNSPAGKTIDERMAALLEDHKRMGSR